MAVGSRLTRRRHAYFCSRKCSEIIGKTGQLLFGKSGLGRLRGTERTATLNDSHGCPLLGATSVSAPSVLQAPAGRVLDAHGCHHDSDELPGQLSGLFVKATLNEELKFSGW